MGLQWSSPLCEALIYDESVVVGLIHTHLCVGLLLFEGLDRLRGTKAGTTEGDTQLQDHKAQKAGIQSTTEGPIKLQVCIFTNRKNS
jgi:hypothetical protein